MDNQQSTPAQLLTPPILKQQRAQIFKSTFQLPMFLGEPTQQYNSDFIKDAVLKKDELLYFSLGEIARHHFNNAKVVNYRNIKLEQVQNNINITLHHNDLFIVRIGTKKAYDNYLAKPLNDRTFDEDIFVDAKLDYQQLFSGFLKGLFNSDEGEFLDKAYAKKTC